MKLMPSPNGNSPKANVIAQVMFGFVYDDSVVHRFNDYITRTHYKKSKRRFVMKLMIKKMYVTLLINCVETSFMIS